MVLTNDQIAAIMGVGLVWGISFGLGFILLDLIARFIKRKRDKEME